jgi:thiamine-phosphate pyrophosphorylase
MRGLYAITPETLDLTALVDKVRHAINGGAAVVQYRSKRLAPELEKKQAKALRVLTRQTGTLFIVNDNYDLAFSVGADGVHLGQDDGDPDAVCRLREQRVRRDMRSHATPFMIGVSCYNELSLAESAVAAGAGYIAFGSFFPSTTKPEARRADPALIRAARAKFDVPIVAIGGITVDNAQRVISAGADMVAVITSLFGADDIELRAREFTNLFKPENHVHQ